MLILLLGTMMIFGALFLVFAAFGSMSGQSQGVQRSLEMLDSMGVANPTALTAELDKSFGERILDPLLQRFQTLGRRLTGADQEERIRAKLDRAGNPSGWTVDRVLSARVLGAIVGAGFAGYFWMLLQLVAPRGRVRPGGGPGRRLPVPGDLALQHRHQARPGDAAWAGRRHRPAHHLRGGRPRLRRRPPAGRQEHRGPAGGRAQPRPAGDADRPQPVRGTAGDGRPHQAHGRPVLRQRDGAGRRVRHPDRPGAAGAVRRRSASSDGSGPRRRPARCRSRS